MFDKVKIQIYLFAINDILQQEKSHHKLKLLKINKVKQQNKQVSSFIFVYLINQDSSSSAYFQYVLSLYQSQFIKFQSTANQKYVLLIVIDKVTLLILQISIRTMDQYRLQSKKGEGTFSQVFMAQSIRNHKMVAIKCMKKKYETIEKVKKLKEIQALKLLTPHDNIIKLIEVLYDQPTGKLALVFELMEQNLYECLVRNKNLHPQKVKYYMFELLKAIEYIHAKGIFHRDIKPQNVLISGDSIKLADFGSCKGIFSKQPYTEYISTRWYRAPECLMTDGYYDSKMDVWGYGCVLFEMIAKYPLFNGKGELDQIHKINKVLGTPKQSLIDLFKSRATHMSQNEFNFPQKKGIGFEKLLPNASKQLIDLLYKLLAYDPAERITAKQAMKHQFFSDLLQEKFRSTIFGMPHSHSINKAIEHDETPQKTMKIKKKRADQLEDQINSLPPIHQLRLDVKLNLYGTTSKTQDNVFKKTLASINKKKQEHMIIGGINGKKMDR